METATINQTAKKMNEYGIQMPDGVQVDESTDTQGRFVIQPLERGYGITIGNALRRVMLSSLQALHQAYDWRACVLRPASHIEKSVFGFCSLHLAQVHTFLCFNLQERHMRSLPRFQSLL